MKKLNWIKIKKISNITINNLKINDIFLTGQSVINQLDTKEKGDNIVYYKVVSIVENRVEYTPIYDILED